MQLGVKGMKEIKDSGVEASFVSADKYAAMVTLSSVIISTLSIPSLCDQGNGNVAKETKVKSLSVNFVKDSKDDGVMDSYVSADKYADVDILSSVISY